MKKRFTTEEQIVAAIDGCHRRAQELAVEAEALDKEADEYFRHSELGDKLSEFRTQVIPQVTTDTSVQV